MMFYGFYKKMIIFLRKMKVVKIIIID